MQTKNEIRQPFSMEQLAKNIMDQILNCLQGDHKIKLVITVPRIAELLDINTTKAYELVRRQDFPSFKLGSKYCIPILPFLSWIEKEARKHSP